MLRMVCCDLDGTLLPATDEAVSAELLDVFRRLTDKGILVVIASGRPYEGLKGLFGDLAQRLIFICLDGAVTWHRNCVLHKRPLLRKSAEELLQRYSAALVHGRQRVYDVQTISPGAIGEPFLKLELPDGDFSQREEWFRVAYRGAGVTELVAPCADKGNAVRTVMEKFGITPEQTVAFGDGDNDVVMLTAVGHPYLMQSSSLALSLPNLKRTGNVSDTLKDLFRLP